jgi:twitching motility protein PilT
MITSIIQGGRAQGMQLMDDALMVLVEQKRITPHEAYMKATNKAKFEALVKDDEV